MLSSRAQPELSRLPRSTLAPLLVFLALVAFLAFGKTAQVHDHGHGRSAVAQTPSSSTTHAGESASGENLSDDREHGHRHSGDPLTDLLTLGHNHIGGTCPGLPPTLWFLAAAPRVTQLVVPCAERSFGDSPRDTPFRPPIV